jgi:hypothetical protein
LAILKWVIRRAGGSRSIGFRPDRGSADHAGGAGQAEQRNLFDERGQPTFLMADPPLTQRARLVNLRWTTTSACSDRTGLKRRLL